MSKTQPVYIPGTHILPQQFDRSSIHASEGGSVEDQIVVMIGTVRSYPGFDITRENKKITLYFRRLVNNTLETFTMYKVWDYEPSSGEVLGVLKGMMRAVENALRPYPQERGLFSPWIWKTSAWGQYLVYRHTQEIEVESEV